MQSISEHEAWKRVLEELPKTVYVCPTVLKVVLGRSPNSSEEQWAMYTKMRNKVLAHKNSWYRRYGHEFPGYRWPAGRRGNLCRRLFVERMIRQTSVARCDRCNAEGPAGTDHVECNLREDDGSPCGGTINQP
jgi:hypothetical protein